MMFEIKDYDKASALADEIKTIADKFMSVFNEIDNNMRRLYGDAWQSSGADVSNGSYQEKRQLYEDFYAKVIKMKNYIYEMTAKNKAADKDVSDLIQNN